MPTDAFSPETSLDGQALLDSAEQWRAAAREAIREGEWDKVDAALGMAETSYESGLRLTPDGDLKNRLAEGRALCTVLRSDVELRHWRLPSAEARLDEAYKAFKALADGVVGAELWRLTARLAERQGRWASAKAAWKRVLKLTEGENEVAFGDALVRLAEVEVIQGNNEKADETLARAEDLVRDLEDDVLRARVLSVRAAELELQGLHAAAWESWQDAQMSTSVAPSDFSGLLKLRMAGTAVWMKPTQAFRLVETGYEKLVSANHPDSLGLAYHQLSVLALVVQDPVAAIYACIGARRCRSGYDDTTMPVLAQALRRAGFETTAESFEAAETPPEDLEEQVARCVGSRVDDYGTAWEKLGDEVSMLAICSAIRRRGPAAAQLKVEGEEASVVDDHLALSRHRATLTWDAPVDTLGTAKVVSLSAVAPTPPPVSPRVQAAQTTYTDPTLGAVSQRHTPPAPVVAQSPISIPNLLIAAFSMILFLAGVSAFVGVVLIQFFA